MKLVYGLGFSDYESDSLESCPRYLQVIHRSAKSLIGLRLELTKISFCSTPFCIVMMWNPLEKTLHSIEGAKDQKCC